MKVKFWDNMTMKIFYFSYKKLPIYVTVRGREEPQSPKNSLTKYIIIGSFLQRTKYDNRLSQHWRLRDSHLNSVWIISKVQAAVTTPQDSHGSGRSHSQSAQKPKKRQILNNIYVSQGFLSLFFFDE